MLTDFFKNYFAYSRGERNSIIILLVIILLLITANLLLPAVINNQEFNYKEYESELNDFEKSIKSPDRQKLNDINKNTRKKKDNMYQLFRFNPNTADINELNKLGFNEQVIRNIIKYRTNGGCFHKKEDLLKIYGMDTSLYSSLVSYIYFDQDGLSHLPEEGYRNNATIDNYILIDINKADGHLLIESLGLEKNISERVIKYRNLLGGFSDKNQFNEIYGVTKAQCALLADNVFIDTTLIRKININRANEQTLDRHPYLNEYYAKAITKYRKFAGEIKKINELSVNNILPGNIYFQVRPYLSVN